MRYEELTKQEKRIVDKVDSFWNDESGITRQGFVKCLAFLINKYKINSKK